MAASGEVEPLPLLALVRSDQSSVPCTNTVAIVNLISSQKVGNVTLWIILVGSGIAILLVVVGAIDNYVRRSAWRAIAGRRRANWEERERLTAVLSTLSQKEGTCQCKVCSVVRRTPQPTPTELVLLNVATARADVEPCDP